MGVLLPEGLKHGRRPAAAQRDQPPTVYLTYDDGPNPSITPALLDVLARERVQATFLLNDEHVTAETAPIVRRMFVDGRFGSVVPLGSGLSTRARIEEGITDQSRRGKSIVIVRAADPWTSKKQVRLLLVTPYS
jgi:peptidoglycan/xylan/chitin deacetylase (PgdA/CDA1 family)